MRQLFILESSAIRDSCIKAIESAKGGYCVEIKPKTRSLRQNSLLWPLLDKVSKEVVWHGRKLSAESWKHIFTSALKSQDVVPNLNGDGFVVIGQSTSKMTKSEISDLIELIHAFIAQQT